MGYESRLYVVNKHDLSYIVNGVSRKDGETIAVFNLCKVPAVSDRMLKYPATDCYIFADDGDTEITEDKYGKPLREIPVQDAIQILEDAQHIEDYYRRYEPCIQLLRGFALSDWQNLVVLHYGY